MSLWLFEVILWPDRISSKELGKKTGGEENGIGLDTH